MDVMTRRHMLLSLLSGGDAMIGELSRYEKKTLTFPNASNTNSYGAGATIPCSFFPKIMLFSGGTDADGNIISGIYYFINDTNKRGAGGTMFRNLANHNLGSSGVATRVVSELPTSAANACYYDSTAQKIYITRTGGNGYWSNTDEYTFEIYG